ncbi:UvrD-helicase domain-containing protein [Candidatus Parcubacteria bacterium]|nr:UvrD-helicase domain-containing protein [Candidatus Parcubacteria bacterium]
MAINLDHLNAPQRQAVEALDGPLLILAGAGAGKTKTLTERIRHLIYKGVAPHQILAITFTNKAAREMRERLHRMLESDKNLNRPVTSFERPFVSTFHALCVFILKAEHQKVGIHKHFTIFDKADGKRAIKEALEKKGLDPKLHEPERILSIISKEKGRDTTAEEYAIHSEGGYFTSVVAEIWTEYEKILKRDSALDFDDLLLKTARLLRNDKEVRMKYQNFWQYVHIDEYQDTNKVQYEISKLLVGDRHNICVVGDIDQNIYSWRGADIQNILNFERDYSEAKVIILEENYRSTKTILNAANIIIEKNRIRRKKNLFTSNSEGDRIGIYSGFDEVAEANFIVSKVREFIKNGMRPDEIAVLYRANFQSRALEEAFLVEGVPYQLLGTQFFDRREVKDILSYIRAALNPDALSDKKRIINVPARGLGKTTVAKIFLSQEEGLPAATKLKLRSFNELLEEIKKTAEEKSPSETVAFVIRASGLEDEWKAAKKEEDAERLLNAYELASFAARYDSLPLGEGIEKFLEDAALQSDQDTLDEEKNGVRLMTVHASKGLEFDIVFISGLEDGLFPHQKVTKEGITPEEAEEERRLFYVALTRARKKVFLTYAQVRMVYGRRQVNIPSEFIFDVPEELTEEEIFNEEGIPRRPLMRIDF